MLTAQDAICTAIAKVSEEMHARALGSNTAGYEAYAVFSSTDTDGFSGDFLGMVSQRKATLYPFRIFADLLQTPAIVPVEEQTPLSQVFDRFDIQQLEMLPVMNRKREFFGAVTRHSLLETLLNRERENVKALQQEVAKGKRLQRELLHTIAELKGGISQETVDREQGQQHVEALASSFSGVTARDRLSLSVDDQSYLIQLLRVSRFKISQARQFIQHRSDHKNPLQELDHILQELLRVFFPRR